MANTLANNIPKLLAQGLMCLRENAITVNFVNMDYDELAAQRGSTIDIPLTREISVNDVSPSASPPTTADTTTDVVQIELDQWKEAAFYMTDKDLLEVQGGTLPQVAAEAVKALANNIDEAILGTYTEAYGWQGTAGTTPFASDTTDATQIRKVLNNQLAPLHDRYVIVDPDCEANMLGIRAFQDGSYSGSYAAIREGKIEKRLGMGWIMNQNVRTHSNAGGAGWLVNKTNVAVGDSSVPIDTGTGNPGAGDIFTVNGDTQTYVVNSYASNTLNFSPNAEVAWGNNAAITFKANHVVNYAFQKGAIAFCNRPLQKSPGLGNLISSTVDPVSGLALRLEVSRENKRTRYAFDVLYGVKLIRPELAARLAG